VKEVLVVDDTADCREPLKRFLNVSGYHAVTASSGQEALAYLQRNHVDVILLDLMMPEMDGVTFLQALRSHDRWREMPVIVVTALSDGPMLREALVLGASGPLVKSSFTGDQLLQRLRETHGSSPVGRS
jgi:two-component system chemotaxis sensor kinase CheA